MGGKRGQSTLLQEHWYARWIEANCKSLKPRHRKKPEDELALVCRDVAEGTLLPPHNLRPNWFKRMLDKNVVLKSTYRDLSEIKLRARLDDSSVDPDALPPLHRKFFKDKSRQP
jgi:hypothetical protein